MESMYKFNVLIYDFNHRKVMYYDVIPYFVREWNSDYCKTDRETITTFAELQDWIKHRSMYHFWSRCEYECLVGPWPYNENTLVDDLVKIDVHYQILANLDVVTDVVGKEFGLWE